jgi:hypothetical protein
MVADPPGDRLDFADRAEIERAAPHKGMNRLQEVAPEIGVAGRLAGANEDGALPGCALVS